ncbi:hypothetical protein [Azospirillum halopraeferens]|uniref:hypothetical protein n=1 Tax=Azospirillum halopraeferens TaxID=34010 RepID=UPI00048FD207|nr:hypothetical protein [Azospirillum halopraeferens]
MTHDNQNDHSNEIQSDQPASEIDSPFCTVPDLTEDELVQRREALIKMAALTGVATPSILAVLQSRRVLAASGGEC